MPDCKIGIQFNEVELCVKGAFVRLLDLFWLSAARGLFLSFVAALRRNWRVLLRRLPARLRGALVFSLPTLRTRLHVDSLTASCPVRLCSARLCALDHHFTATVAPLACAEPALIRCVVCSRLTYHDECAGEMLRKHEEFLLQVCCTERALNPPLFAASCALLRICACLLPESLLADEEALSAARRT